MANVPRWFFALVLALNFIVFCDTSSAQQTLSVQIGGNLDMSTPTIGAIPPTPTTAGPFLATDNDWTDLSGVAAGSTTVQLYDSLGATHNVTIFFFHTGMNAWEARAYVDGGDITGAIAARPVMIAIRAMTFDAGGTKTAPPAGTPDFDNVTVPWKNGSFAAQQVDFTLAPFSQFAGGFNIDYVHTTNAPAPAATPTPSPTPVLEGETASITVYGNLDSGSAIRIVPAQPTWVQLNQIADILYTPRIIDSAGTPHYLYIFLVHRGQLQWAAYAMSDSDTNLLPAGPRTLVFDSHARRILPVPPWSDMEITYTWPGGATSNIDFTFNMTCFWSTSGVSYAAYTAHDPIPPAPTPSPTVTPVPTLAPFSRPHTMDFDADGKDDAVAWRPATGRWTVRKSSDGSLLEVDFGRANDVPLVGDYDGDALPDLVLWRKSRGIWYICPASRRYDCSKFRSIEFGGRQGTPVASDFDGDGVLELSLWLPGGTKYVYKNPITGATGEIDLDGRRLDPVMGINIQ